MRHMSGPSYTVYKDARFGHERIIAHGNTLFEESRLGASFDEDVFCFCDRHRGDFPVRVVVSGQGVIRLLGQNRGRGARGDVFVCRDSLALGTELGTADSAFIRATAVGVEKVATLTRGDPLPSQRLIAVGAATNL